MRYHALVCDYDGTIAADGRVDAETAAALERVRESGRKLLLVTGRERDDLQRVFDRLDLFDLVVVENGALLYRPDAQEERTLAEPPEERFVEALRERAVSPLSVGRVIVATWEPNETTVLEVIRETGLELQVIFNKGAVMVLPSGVSKASGLSAALRELGLSPHNAVGVGDAENDHAFLALCECAVAVANALPVLKDRCDLVTDGARGAGVAELVELLLADDLASVAPRLERHRLAVGDSDGGPLWIEPCGVNVLVAGPSGSGKSTFAMGFLERLAEAGYQFCLIDPEGDYAVLEEGVVLGDAQHEPGPAEAAAALDDPEQNVIVNLLGVALEDRPRFFEALLPRIVELRGRSGRPHWLVVDDAHHLLPAAWQPETLIAGERFGGLLLITVHPESLAPGALEATDVVVATGEEGPEALAQVARARGRDAPRPESVEGEAIFWDVGGSNVQAFEILPSRFEHLRHTRKYAEGDLGPERSFYFRGPRGDQQLRAQNLMLFLQLADGVNDETWLHHLHQGDYSRWLRESIKDDDLADEVARVEQGDERPADEARRLIRDAIESRYTSPA